MSAHSLARAIGFLEIPVPSTTTDNLAVLVDADNAQASVIADLLAEVARYVLR